jgi:hypothetical protein
VKWKLKVIHKFAGATGDSRDGCQPYATLAFDVLRNLYGTTNVGGNGGQNGGTVFKLAPNSGGGWKESIVYRFQGGNDGANPLYGAPILDSTGNLYGMTSSGDPENGGVVYEVNPSVAPTTTTLTSSVNPSTYLEPVTFSAMVVPEPPNGETVTFMNGKTVLGTGTLSGGSAIFTTSTLKVGTTSVTSVYGGDFNFGGSKSKPLKQVVDKATD